MEQQDATELALRHYLVCPDLDEQRKVGPNARYAVDAAREWILTTLEMQFGSTNQQKEVNQDADTSQPTN